MDMYTVMTKRLVSLCVFVRAASEDWLIVSFKKKRFSPWQTFNAGPSHLSVAHARQQLPRRDRPSQFAGIADSI
jgi:hypothetical protein